MQWSPQQDAALRAVAEWLRAPWAGKKPFYLAGVAGTGKTTLSKQIAEMVEGPVKFASFTGKAASVLRSKGCEGAQTIHQLIYQPKEKPRVRLLQLQDKVEGLKVQLQNATEDAVRRQLTVELTQTERALAEEKKTLRQPTFGLQSESEAQEAALIIIDECSMVDKRVGGDLMSFGVPILVLGDPFQLPPVMGAGYFTSRKPDFMLTEIHRQALDSPIIRMATTVREGKTLKHGDYGDGCAVVKWQDRPDVQQWMEADQVICGRNATRKTINRRFREVRGYKTDLPVAGERLVCLRNDYKIPGGPLLNGTIWVAATDAVQVEDDKVTMTIRPEEGGPEVPVDIWIRSLTGYLDKEDWPWNERKEAQEFTYGYALTCHKAQGSQYNSVVVIDQSGFLVNKARDDLKWKYTSLTRAVKKVVMISG